MELVLAVSGFQFLGDVDDEPVRWKSSNCCFEEVIARERESLHLSFLLTVMTTGIQMRVRQCVLQQKQEGGNIPGIEEASLCVRVM